MKKFPGHCVALTYGEWEVLKKHIWVDAARELVYFLGLRESPLEKHLYVVSLRKPGKIRLLTKPGHSYSIDLNKVFFFFSNSFPLQAGKRFFDMKRVQHPDIIFSF